MPSIPHFVDVQRVPPPKLKILYETLIGISLHPMIDSQISEECILDYSVRVRNN